MVCGRCGGGDRRAADCRRHWAARFFPTTGCTVSQCGREPPCTSRMRPGIESSAVAGAVACWVEADVDVSARRVAFVGTRRGPEGGSSAEAQGIIC